MNEDKLQLPGFLIADLYKNSLVILDDVPKTVITTTKKGKTTENRQWYLGSNLQKITILVNEKDAVYLGDESLQFLSAILGACKLNLGDVAIVNHLNDPLVYTEIKEKLSPAFLILFGVDAKDIRLSFTIPHYQVQKYDNSQILLVPELGAMLGNSQEAKLEKSKLWLCLKKMFAI